MESQEPDQAVPATGLPVAGPAGTPTTGLPTAGSPPAGPPTANPSEAPHRQAVSAGTRSSATWTALAVGTLLLVVMLVFILQNLQDARVSFFALHWRIPVALDLLLAAVLGAAVVLSAGAVRLLQLRLQARRHVRSDRAKRPANVGMAPRP